MHQAQILLGPSAIPPQTTLTWPSWSVTRSALVTVIPETWARRSGGNSCRIEMAALIPSGSGTSDAALTWATPAGNALTTSNGTPDASTTCS